MQLIQITSKEQLNNFVSAQPHAQFLQSWEWGEFHKNVSGRVWRIGVEEGGKLIASVKIIEKKLPINKKYFYCARGPIVAGEFKNRKEILNILFSEVERLGKEEEAMFFRFDPIYPVEDHIIDTEGKNISIIQTHGVQPRKTLVVDIDKSEKEIESSFHQKTRYNIHLAEKKGVKIVESDKSRFEEFWHLLDQASGRDKFRPHGRNYYNAMLDVDKNIIKMFFAEYEGQAIATGIFSFYGDTVTYLHGGSSDEHRNVMAPHLLQWEVMKLAKSLGYKYYDFHGIDDEKYPGVTRFKKGFSGEEADYPGTFDLIYDEGWYSIYKMIRKVRRSF